MPDRRLVRIELAGAGKDVDRAFEDGSGHTDPAGFGGGLVHRLVHGGGGVIAVPGGDRQELADLGLVEVFRSNWIQALGERPRADQLVGVRAVNYPAARRVG